jgi:hypothetical protein
MVRTLKEMLRSCVDQRQNDWTHHLAALEFAYNNSIQASTQLTPFELYLGYHPKSPYSFLTDDMPAVKTVEEFVENLEALQHQAIEFLEHARQNQAKEVNRGRLRPKVMSVGQSVFLSTQYIQPAFMRTTRSRKLRAKYIGPFQITKRVSPTSYELDLPANFKVHPVINLEYLKEFHPNPERFVGRPVDPRNQKLNDEEVVDSSQIEAIRDHRESRYGRLQYLCHHRGTADHDDVYEHAEHVASNASGKNATDRYWSELYKQQKLDSVGKKTKKQRKPREKKAAVRKEAEKQPSDTAVMRETPSEVTHVSGDIIADAHVVQ